MFYLHKVVKIYWKSRQYSNLHGLKILFEIASSSDVKNKQKLTGVIILQAIYLKMLEYFRVFKQRFLSMFTPITFNTHFVIIPYAVTFSK